MKDSTSKFIFLKNDDIGAAAAEDDSMYLNDCFVDTGDIQALIDCEDPKRIIIGRTGTGKTALLQEINARRENVISLSPHDLPPITTPMFKLE